MISWLCFGDFIDCFAIWSKTEIQNINTNNNKYIVLTERLGFCDLAEYQLFCCKKYRAKCVDFIEQILEKLASLPFWILYIQFDTNAYRLRLLSLLFHCYFHSKQLLSNISLQKFSLVLFIYFVCFFLTKNQSMLNCFQNIFDLIIFLMHYCVFLWHALVGIFLNRKYMKWEWLKKAYHLSLID